MSDSQNDHIDPDPIRPSQAEGEPEDTSGDSAESPLDGAQGENGQADPLRPSKADGGPEDGAGSAPRTGES